MARHMGSTFPPASAPLRGPTPESVRAKRSPIFVQELVGILLISHGAFMQDLASRHLSDQHEYNSNDIHRVHDGFIHIHL